MIEYKKFNLKDYGNCFVVTDIKLSKLYNIVGNNVFVLPCGEKDKSFFYAKKMCSWLLQQGAQKDDKIVAIGGGSVGDVVGFVAGIYKRGVKLVHVPTTLLAQIDSSIGGKTALDLDNVKNAVGTYFMADTVIDVDFLKTLPPKQWKNGQGELLKYRMLCNEIDKIYLNGDISQTVKACAEFKQRVCEKDPFDKAERRLLNFGHTIGHAMELSLKMSHGEAVANGLYYETLLAEKLGLINSVYLKNWQAEIQKYFCVKPLTLQILKYTLQDKKNKNGQVGFVVPTENGFCVKFLPEQQLNLLL